MPLHSVIKVQIKNPFWVNSKTFTPSLLFCTKVIKKSEHSKKRRFFSIKIYNQRHILDYIPYLNLKPIILVFWIKRHFSGRRAQGHPLRQLILLHSHSSVYTIPIILGVLTLFQQHSEDTFPNHIKMTRFSLQDDIPLQCE